MAQENKQVGSQPTGNEHQVPEALRDFAQLPNEAHVRIPVVKALYGCSDATVWRMVKSGRMPHPKKFSDRITAWEVGALRKSLAAA